MQKYEVLYILASALEDNAKEALVERFQKVVTAAGGEVENINKWGNRRLAYPINFKTEGYYVLMNYSAPSDLNRELERQLRIAKDEVVRFVIAKQA